jgi:hypothetical protein
MYSLLTRRVLQLGTAAAIATLIAACSSDVTAPNRASVGVTQRSAVHDDIQGDTTLCRSGWVVVAGRYVCNPS